MEFRCPECGKEYHSDEDLVGTCGGPNADEEQVGALTVNGTSHE